MASNFRAADQVYLPAAGHLAGASGTFISDVFISNLSGDTVSVSVIYAAGQGGTQVQFPNVITLGPNERQEILDIFPNKLNLATGFGQLIFNGCKQGGNCDVNSCPNGATTGVCPDFRDISVESRSIRYLQSTNPALAPTTGQLFSGIPWYNFVSLTPLQSASTRSSSPDSATPAAPAPQGTYRGNIGLRERVAVFDDDPARQALQRPQWYAARQHVPADPLGLSAMCSRASGAMFGAFTGATATERIRAVEQTGTSATGEAARTAARTAARRSSRMIGLDNSSGDATTLEPQYLKPLTSAAINCIYSSTGCKGAFNLHRAVKH